MKRLIILSIAFWGFISCEETEVIVEKLPEYEGKFANNEVCKTGDCDFGIVQSSKLDVEEHEYGFYVNVVSGSKMVFNFQYDFHDQEQIADDELTEIVYFEVQSSPATGVENTETNSFQLTAEDANAYFGAICFCGGGPFYKVTEGTVVGKQVSDTLWDVDVDIVVEGDHYPKRIIQYSARYVVK